MKTVNDLILERAKAEFERMDVDQNVWIMALAAIPFSEEKIAAEYLPYKLGGDRHDLEQRSYYMGQGTPTHIVRVILRTRNPQGPLDYVDGTDIYMIVDADQQFADSNIWSESWVDGPPKLEGSPIQSALKWVKLIAEPFYVQLQDPFLTLEQQSQYKKDDGGIEQNQQKTK